MIGPATRITAVLPHIVSRTGLHFARGGILYSAIFRLMRSLTGHEAVNGYKEGDACYVETI
jgi:hypothetical protein